MAFTKITKATTLLSAGWDAFNTLIDDLLSTSNGKGASQIGLEDAGGNVDADNLEDAVAEIYTDLSGTMDLAEVFNENADTTTGLTWGYKAGTIRADEVITTVAAGTLALVDDATNYVEINSSGTVSRNTTSFTQGQIPIRQITTVGGSQTVSTDKRSWFQVWLELKDEDDMASDSATAAASQQSIKKFAEDKISDTAYDATSWNGVTTIAPSKNAIRDKLEAMIESGTIMIFGQASAPTGWTKKTDWQDNAMLCYSTGSIGSGGGVNPQSTHTHTGPSHNHPWLVNNGGSENDQTYSSDGTLVALQLGAGKDAGKYYILRSDTGGETCVGDGYTGNEGTGATGANTAPYYQEVIAATKD